MFTFLKVFNIIFLQVLVMTTQILVDVLNHGYLSLSNINLIIMDECHHTIKEHPMRQLMLFYKNRRDENISLRILGKNFVFKSNLLL